MSKKKSMTSQTNMQIKRMIANGIVGVRNKMSEDENNIKYREISKYHEGSSQDFIPVDKVEDGIIKTTDGRYIGVIEVYPINFRKLASNERKVVLLNWQKLYEGGPSKIQIKAMCDFFNPEKLIRNIQKECAKFNDQSIQEAKNVYIRHITNYSNADAISTRYFIIYQYSGNIEGKISKNFDEIVIQMQETESFIRGICESCGNVTYSANDNKEKNKAVIEFLYYYFNRNTSRNESINNRAKRIKDDFHEFNEQTGLNKKPRIVDIFAPKGIRFTNRNFMYMDGEYYTYLGIVPRTYPELVCGGWVDELFNFLQYTDFDIISYKYPKEFTEMSLSGINKVTESGYKRQMYRNKQDKAEKYAMKFKNNAYVQKHMQNLKEDLWKTAIVVTVKAPTERVLFRVVNYIKKELDKYHVKTDDAFDCVEDYFTLTMPLLCASPVFKRLRHDTLSSQMGTTYCFSCYELYDPKGYLLGKNMDTNAIACPNNFDTERYKNGNTVLIGTSGAGKTFTEQVIGTRCLMNGMRVFSIIPAKGYEYEPGCKMVGGTFIRYYPGSKDCLNPMEIRPSGDFDSTMYEENDKDVSMQEATSLLARKVTFLIIWLQLQTNTNEIDTTAYSKLQQVIPNVYYKYGITEDNKTLFDEDGKLKTMPILSDLLKEFEKHKELTDFASIVRGIVKGPFKNLDGQTNVDINKRYLVFDVDERHIGSKLIAACLFAAFDYANTAVLENPLSKDIVVLDEVWKMLRLSSCADQVKNMIKLIRGYGGFVILATQELNDFINHSNGYGISVLSNSEIKICLNLKEEEIKMVRDHMRLSEVDCNKIRNFKKGQALFIANRDKISISIDATDVEMYTFTTDVNMRRKIAEKRSFNVKNLAV